MSEWHFKASRHATHSPCGTAFAYPHKFTDRAEQVTCPECQAAQGQHMTQTPELLPVTPLALKSLQRIAAIPSLPGIDRPLRLSPRDATAILASLSHAIHEPASVMREALEAIKAGDVPRPVTNHWRADEAPSKHDMCAHGLCMYQDCSNCTADFIDSTLAAIRNLPLSDGVG